MVLELAKSALEKKMKFESNAMTGNYEFYYGAGILSRLTDHELTNIEQPKSVQQELLSLDYQAKDNQEKALVYMFTHYETEPFFDSQMKELFELGKQG